MRVGIFTDSYVPHPDGIAIAVDTIRDALTRQGHEVYIFCPSRPGVKYDKNVIAYPSVPALIYDGLRAAWPFGRKKMEQVAELKLDVIHIHLPFNIGFAGLRAARRFNIPLVMSCHQDMDYVLDYPGSFLLGLMIIIPTAIFTGQYKQALRVIFSKRINKNLARRYDFIRRAYCYLTDQCDLTIAPSHKIYEQLMPYSAKKNFSIVPNAIDPEQLPQNLNRRKARTELAIHQDVAVMVTTSRLVREKQINLVIDGFAKLRRRRKDVELYIIGDGPMRTSLEHQVFELGLDQSVTFCGSQPHLQVFHYLAAADIYVNACQREIMSLSALEAAAMAKPLLIFDERLVEIIDNGENGYFVKTPTELAKMAETILADKNLAKKLGNASKNRIMNRYNITKHGQGLTEAYAMILGGDSNK